MVEYDKYHMMDFMSTVSTVIWTEMREWRKAARLAACVQDKCIVDKQILIGHTLVIAINW